jgi:Fic family protein
VARSVFLPFVSDEVSDLVVEIDAARVRAEAKGPLPRSWETTFTRDVDAEAIAAAVSVEATEPTPAEVHRILAGERPPELTEDDRARVLGYEEAKTLIRRWADHTSVHWTPQLVGALHARVLAGNWSAGAGELATRPRRIVERLSGEDVYAAPASDQVPALLDQACERMERLREHPAVAAAWIHVAVMSILPFLQGNTGVADLVAALAMRRGGFRRVEFSSLERWRTANPAEYYGALACLGSEFHRSADVTAFIRTHLHAQLQHIRILDLRERIERQIWTAVENLVSEARLPSRIGAAVWDAFHGRDITAGQYARRTGVSPATTTTDLNAAVAAALLDAVGERRGRRYGAGPALPEKIGDALALSLERQQEIERETIMDALRGRLELVRDGPLAQGGPAA